jgi:hypothetical protein
MQDVDAMGLAPAERAIAVSLHERGYAVFEFPDDDVMARIDRIIARLAPEFEADFSDPEADKNVGDMRMQDAWTFDEDVRAIAANEAVLALLGKLYGRRAFPFQTLNFPVGTQQHLHSDSIHFSSIPERFMCGVWLAFEDVHPDAGPLTYLPGSHKWPILSNAMVGRSNVDDRSQSAQAPFEPVWCALVEAAPQSAETFLPRKGQALIWAANLLHGGSPQTDLRRTRWSQVTHYYFDDCTYYTPAFSDEGRGVLDLRAIVDVTTGEFRQTPRAEEAAAPKPRKSFLSRATDAVTQKTDQPGLPADFDAEQYYRWNPDVALSGSDAATHYLQHGKAEGRRYRVPARR